jgi:hypothetical protein
MKPPAFDGGEVYERLFGDEDFVPSPRPAWEVVELSFASSRDAQSALAAPDCLRFDLSAGIAAGAARFLLRLPRWNTAVLVSGTAEPLQHVLRISGLQVPSDDAERFQHAQSASRTVTARLARFFRRDPPRPMRRACRRGLALVRMQRGGARELVLRTLEAESFGVVRAVPSSVTPAIAIADPDSLEEVRRTYPSVPAIVVGVGASLLSGVVTVRLVSEPLLVHAIVEALSQREAHAHR